MSTRQQQNGEEIQFLEQIQNLNGISVDEAGTSTETLVPGASLNPAGPAPTPAGAPNQEKDSRIKGPSYNKGATALFFNATSIVAGTSSKQENKEDDIYNEKFNRKIIISQTKDEELKANERRRQENRLCPSSWFICPHEQKCERISWKLCFLCCCLPLCYPCYLTRILRKKSSKEQELENRDLEIGNASRTSNDCIISQNRFGQLWDEGSKNNTPRKGDRPDLPDHSIDVVFTQSEINKLVLDKLERCSGFNNLKNPKVVDYSFGVSGVDSSANIKQDNSSSSLLNSSPVTLRRSGQQVRVPIHPSPSAAALYPGHPSGVIPVHPSPGGTLQEHEVFQQGDSQAVCSQPGAATSSHPGHASSYPGTAGSPVDASMLEQLPGSYTIQSRSSSSGNRDSDKYFSCDSLDNISTLTSGQYFSAHQSGKNLPDNYSPTYQDKPRGQRFNSLPNDTEIGDSSTSYGTPLRKDHTKSNQVLTSSVSSPSKYFSAMDSRSSQNTLFGAGSLMSEQIDTPRDRYTYQDKTNCDILIDNHDNTILNEASDTKHLNGDVRSNIGEIDAFLTEKQDEGEGLWMKLKEEKMTSEVVDACNTHEMDNTDNSAASHDNSNKELELTCDNTTITSPRIIIHNSDNHENNNHIDCGGNHVTTKINSNHKFTNRIEELSTAAGQYERLLDGNSSGEFSAVDGHSDHSVDDLNDQTTIQCDDFIQSDHVKSQVGQQSNNHVTNSCLHHVAENCAGKLLSCDTPDIVCDSGEQTLHLNQSVPGSNSNSTFNRNREKDKNVVSGRQDSQQDTLKAAAPRHTDCSIIVETASLEGDGGMGSQDGGSSIHRFDKLYWHPKKVGSITRKFENQSFLINFYQDVTEKDSEVNDSVFDSSAHSEDLPCINTIIAVYCNSTQLNQSINQNNSGVLAFIEEYWHGYHPLLLLRLHHFMDNDSNSARESEAPTGSNSKLGIKLSVLQHFTKSFRKSASDPSSATPKINVTDKDELDTNTQANNLSKNTKLPVLPSVSSINNTEVEKSQLDNDPKSPFLSNNLPKSSPFTLKDAKSSPFFVNQTITDNPKSTNLLHPQKVSPWVNSINKAKLTTSISSPPDTSPSKEPRPPRVSLARSSSSQQPSTQTRKGSQWSRLFSHMKDKDKTDKGSTAASSGKQKVKMVGLNLGNLLKQQQQPAGLEPSDPWDKDKVKNPERFSDLHRIICEKDLNGEFLLESIARYHLHTTVYQCTQRYGGTETTQGTVGLQVKGAGSTDTLTYRPPAINPPEWVCPVLCHLTSRKQMKETAKSGRSGFLSTVRKTMLIRRMASQPSNDNS